MTAEAQALKVAVATATRAGRKGFNEDSVFGVDAPPVFHPLRALAVVADGVGGAEHGAEASAAAVMALRTHISGAYSPLCAGDAPLRGADVLRDALYEADRQISAGPAAGGSTTCVAACVCEGLAFIGNVGDSRAYIYRDAVLRQITADDAVGEWDVWDDSGNQARLTNWLGGMPHAPSVVELPLAPGDSLLLCSDGLFSVVDPARIAAILGESSSGPQAVEKLLDKAQVFGAEDDISVAIVSVAAPEAPPAPEAPAAPVEAPRAVTGGWLVRAALYAAVANLVLTAAVLLVLIMLLNALQP